MSDYKSIVPVVANAAVAVSGNITNLIVKTRASGAIQKAQLEMLKDQTSKVLAEAHAHHVYEIVITNLEQIARTQELIDSLERQGRLHGCSLAMALDQLEVLNEMLRSNLKRYDDKGLWW